MSPSLPFKSKLVLPAKYANAPPNSLKSGRLFFFFFLILTSAGTSRLGRKKRWGPYLNRVIDLLLYFYIIAVIPIPCHWQPPFWLAVSPLSGVPGMRWHLPAVCLMWGCSVYLLNCYINEIEISHFLDFHPPFPLPCLPSNK